jgi:hypothetical protein
MPLILGANSVSGFTVGKSLRFDKGSSDRLNKTTSSQTAQRFTFSCWFKLSSRHTERRALFSTDYITNALTSGYLGGQSGAAVSIWNDSTLKISGYGGSVEITTIQLFRDVSAWYHLVWAVDTTQSTSSDRFKVYINGSQITSFSGTYPPQNQNIEYKNHSIGSYSDQHSYGDPQAYTNFFDGYMSEIYLIDGQQLTPSSFGETDTTSGIWIPKAYTGSFGTNGFYLKFANSASLGTDSSGNGNNFTVNNLTSIDQTTDTPTNNFCTLNSLSKVGNSTFSNGNLTYTFVNDSGTAGTIGVTKGKWYWEYKFVGAANVAVAGIIDASIIPKININNIGTAGYYPIGNSAWKDTTQVTSGLSGYSNGMIVGCAFDADNGYIYTWVNGVAENSGNAIITGIDMTKTWLPFACTGIPTINLNFGNPPYSANGYTDGAGYGNFSYAVPSGYYSLCTKNLANYG